MPERKRSFAKTRSGNSRKEGIVGSFEKAVPVIFMPRDGKRPLFPWLITGLIPSRGASERADARAVATQVPNNSGIEDENQRDWPLLKPERCGKPERR
jgi:hypothetical protein